jgi:hypothetical protein
MYKRTALLLLLLPALASAQVYRWVDGKGQVHFTQEPPATGKYEKIQQAAPMSGTSPNVEDLQKYNAAAEEARQKQADETAKTQQAAHANADRCARAHAHLKHLEDSPPNKVLTDDSGGGYRRMTEEEYNADVASTKKALAESCTSG